MRYIYCKIYCSIIPLLHRADMYNKLVIEACTNRSRLSKVYFDSAIKMRYLRKLPGMDPDGWPAARKSEEASKTTTAEHAVFVGIVYKSMSRNNRGVINIKFYIEL